MLKVGKNKFLFELFLILNIQRILVPLIRQLPLGHLFPLSPLLFPLLSLPQVLLPQILHWLSMLLLLPPLLFLRPRLPFKQSLLLLLLDLAHELQLLLFFPLHELHKVLGRGVHWGVLALVVSGSLERVRDLFKCVNAFIRWTMVPRKLSLCFLFLNFELWFDHIWEP